MSYPLCRHIRANGRRCRAAALTTSTWCFFHRSLHQSHRRFHHTEATRPYLIPGQHIELTPLEDRESVQIALSTVINALAVGQLETARATALLYGLQLASMNAARLVPLHSHETVRTAVEDPEGHSVAEADFEEDAEDAPDAAQTNPSVSGN
jgi:hypothetical protein